MKPITGFIIAILLGAAAAAIISQVVYAEEGFNATQEAITSNDDKPLAEIIADMIMSKNVTIGVIEK